MFLDIEFLGTQKVLFEGKAGSVIVPGESGEFEVLPFHKNILSRIVTGRVFIDEKGFDVKRGIIKAERNKVTIIAEEG